MTLLRFIAFTHTKRTLEFFPLALLIFYHLETASVAPVFLPSQTHTHPRPSYLLKINDSGAPPITSGETFVCVSPLILDHCCRLNTVPSCVLSRFSHVQLCATLWTVARQAPLSMGFSRLEYRSGLPCPPPGDLPDPGIEPTSLMSPALAGKFFTTNASWQALSVLHVLISCYSFYWLSIPLRAKYKTFTMV